MNFFSTFLLITEIKRSKNVKNHAGVITVYFILGQNRWVAGRYADDLILISKIVISSKPDPFNIGKIE